MEHRGHSPKFGNMGVQGTITAYRISTDQGNLGKKVVRLEGVEAKTEIIAEIKAKQNVPHGSLIMPTFLYNIHCTTKVSST